MNEPTHPLKSRPAKADLFAGRLPGRPRVCVQGLGFVGTAMAAAIADASREDGSPRFAVLGLDQTGPEGESKAAAINAGRTPFDSPDPKLSAAMGRARERGNLIATTDAAALETVDVAVVDIGLDLDMCGAQPRVDYTGFRAAIRTLGARLPEGALVLVETTVPPGTCARIVAPELIAALAARGLSPDSLLLSHSYERVMPGPDYFDSIVNYWRAYAGHTPAAAAACEAFLSQIIDTRRYPLTRLASTGASEMAKVLENSYRAMTIAFMEEWGRFAEAAGIDAFEVVEAIRRRPTHSNIRQPGFGVGGYCLTKDPLFAAVAARDLLDRPDLDFEFSRRAVAVNAEMPIGNLDRLQEALGGDLAGRSLLVLGVTYRADLADTRFSPAEVFVREAQKRGAKIVCHDPLIRQWREMQAILPAELPGAGGFDSVVLAVAHAAYRELDFAAWLGPVRPVLFDASNVLGPAKRRDLAARGFRVIATGVGESA